MTCELTLDGHLSVGGAGCGCSDSGDGVNNTSRGLSLSCSHSTFEAIKNTACAELLATAGAAGDTWAELPVRLSKYALLSMKSSAAIKVRLYAAPATKVGASAIFPATTLNGQTFAVTLDGVAVSFAFVGASLSAAQCAAQINAAAIAAGLDYLPASVNANGQVQLTGKNTGAQGSVLVTTGLAAVGFTTMTAPVLGSGSDLDVLGPFLVQFGTNGPSRVQISGNAKIEVLAAGTP